MVNWKFWTWGKKQKFFDCRYCGEEADFMLLGALDSESASGATCKSCRVERGLKVWMNEDG